MALNVVRADGSQVGYGYDLMGQLTSAVGYEGDGVMLRGNENLGYGYDPAGNLALRTNNTLLQGFEVDHADGLVNISRNNDELTVAGSVNTKLNSFTVNGQAATIYNDLTFAVTNGVTVADGLNVLTTVATSNSVAMTNESVAFLPASVNLASDRNGNLTSDRLHGFTYDDANELTWVTVTNLLQTQFVYDGLGRRRIRRDFVYAPGTSTYVLTNEVRYVYDGMTVVQERDSNNVPLVSYTRGVDLSGTMGNAGGIGGLLARTDTNGSAFYHADGNGNITMLINASGTPVARYLYDPYGNTLGMWGPLASANTYRYASKEMDLNSGLYYFGFRYYEPNLQRWLNRDPLGEAGGINLYSYVGNDPMDFLDPYGLVRWGGVFSATAGIIGNSFGLAGGFALGIGTSWTGVGAVAGGVIAVKSGYGVGANILNLIDAINDREDSNKGSLLNDLAAKAAPCNKDAQKLATALDLAIDLGGSRIAKAAQTVSMADQYGNVVLEGGATLGPTFSESADASIEVLGGVQAGQTILETAFPNIFGEDGQ